ncbi:hypothetical protein M405DRAFT_583439 [Rhizopogon salebrosus TDB-379]|nr:hypothetical protein M405DRAFT_583439 [Rhizopogon salebrosus TDB-379]
MIRRYFATALDSAGMSLMYATHLLMIVAVMFIPMLQRPPARLDVRRLPQGVFDDVRDGVHAHC